MVGADDLLNGFLHRCIFSLQQLICLLSLLSRLDFLRTFSYETIFSIFCLLGLFADDATHSLY